MGGIEVRVLGPVEVVVAGRVLELRGRQQPGLLALLALRAGRVVPVEVLVDALWPERPPASAGKVVQTYVSRLRKLLGGNAIERRGAGYALRLPGDAVDLVRFEQLTAEGRFREALDLWRGPALADVADLPGLRAEAERLEELRLRALEQRIDADIAAGRQGEVVGELRALVAEQPLRERLRGLLMLALYRSGRQAEALAVYQDTRRVLNDELGIEPSADLKRLEREILTQDERLAARGTRDLPTGTVTLLMTDVAGSTRLLAEFGSDRYAHALAEHRRIVRDVFAQHDGVEVDTQGDSFFYAFGRATDAIAAAEDLQAATAGGRIRARIAVHTGEPLVTEEGYFGADVHRVARICAAAHGGQVLVSEPTAQLAPGHTLKPLGGHRLKDVDEPVRLFQLGEGDFPPLRTPTASVVPLPPTPLVGREPELAELRGLLVDTPARLVTITGPGGVGKTRLAMQLASDLAGAVTDGVFFVELSGVRDSTLVVPVIASTIGAQQDLTDHLADKEVVLVLDNLEQVAAAGRDLAALLAACPRLKVLATSREPLHVAAERVYPLPPLAEGPAVELFRQRAAALEPRFAAPVKVLEELCRRLDNLPLAIELAASRARSLGPRELLARLEPRLPLLTSRARDVAERQRTLRATIEWSHALLDDAERGLFRGLSVFAGGFTLPAAEAIAGADVDRLDSLVDKSLIRREHGRYSMLETIREYAGERLVESGEADELRRLHAYSFHRAAIEFADAIFRLDDAGRRAMRTFRDELDNYRAALEWLLAHDVEAGAETLTPLSTYWLRSAQPQEAVVWLDRALAHDAPLSPAIRARVRWQTARMLQFAGDVDRADGLFQESMRHARQSGDKRTLRLALLGLGELATKRGDTETARPLLDEAVALFRDPDAQRPTLAIDYPQGLTLALRARGEVSHVEGDREGAERDFEAALVVARQHRTISLPALLCYIAAIALEEMDTLQAERLYREALAACVEGEMAEWIPWALAGIAAAAAEKGDVQTAGRIWGALETREEQRGRPVMRGRQELEARISALAETNASTFEAAREAGRQLSGDEAVAEALGVLHMATA